MLVVNILVECGIIYYFVNNVGGQYFLFFVLISQKGFEIVFCINLVGGFLVVCEVFNQLMSKIGGSIVNMFVDMWGGMFGMGYFGVVCLGMENFIRIVVVEWGYVGVWVNVVVLGWIVFSGMDIYEGVFKVVILILCEYVLFKCIGSELEVVVVIVFLFFFGVVFVSGNMICIDGVVSQGSCVFLLFKGKLGQSCVYNGFYCVYLFDVLKDQED